MRSQEERLLAEPTDHVLVVEDEDGMRQFLHTRNRKSVEVGLTSDQAGVPPFFFFGFGVSERLKSDSSITGVQTVGR
jgi:hypothetical protein